MKMQNPMAQFLEAMRGLEKTRTPLEEGTQTLTGDTASAPKQQQAQESPQQTEKDL